MNSTKKLANFLAAQVVTTLLFCVVLFGARYHASPVESVTTLLTYTGVTKWPYGYSDREFEKVRIGDTKDSVSRRLTNSARVRHNIDRSHAWRVTIPRAENTP